VSRYRFIAAEKATYPVSLLCRVLGVSRASFYAWCQRGPCARARADQQLLEQITRIHRGSRGTYGAPRVHAELRDDYGVRVGRKRVARLCAPMGWSAATGAVAAGSPILIRRPPRRRTWWDGCSTRARPTGSGLPTSATSPPGNPGSAVRRHTGVAVGLMLQVSAAGVVGSGPPSSEV
jgi:HTH-like domain